MCCPTLTSTSWGSGRSSSPIVQCRCRGSRDVGEDYTVRIGLLSISVATVETVAVDATTAVLLITAT